VGWTEKFAIALSGFAVVLFVFFSLLVHQVKEENEDISKQLGAATDTIEILAATLKEERKKRDKAVNEVERKSKALEEKLSLVEESLDPENFRWAKVKKVRDAVKQTFEDFGYQKTLSTTDITRYSSAVVDWSEQYDVPIPLILAMTRRESAFNPSAKSHAGAMGLIQVMPATAQEIAADLNVHHYSMYKVRDNVRFGVFYIMKMLDQFEGDVNLAVRAYNCGPTYTRKVISGEYSDFPKETIEYARVILGDEERDGFVEYYETMGL